jgi:hypothetical protein
VKPEMKADFQELLRKITAQAEPEPRGDDVLR